MTDSSTRVPSGPHRAGPRVAAALLAVVLVASAVASCSRAGADGVALRGSTTTDGSGGVVVADGGSGVVGAAAATSAPAGAAAGGTAAAGTGAKAAPPGGGAAAGGAGVVAAGDPRPGTKALLAGMHLVNYQPATDAWPGLWTNWRPDLLDRDLAAVAALGGNTVRVSVIPDTFGWPTPKPVMAARLAQYVDLAAAHGLRVQLTLFDWFGRTDQVAQSTTWVRAVTAPYRGDSRVAFVELLNEVDPGDARTTAFLRALLPVVRTALPGVPRTVSVSSTAGPDALRRLVSALPGLLDVADIHYYGEASTAYAWLGRARAEAGGLPLLVGEAGHSMRYPTDTSRGRAHHEALQAVWFDAVLRAGRDRGVPIGVWMLTDLAPTAIPGHTEREAPHEYTFGLRRLDGTLRPAAGVVRAWWSGKAPAGFSDTFSRSSTDGLPPGWRVDRPGAATYGRDAGVGAAAAGSARLSGASGDPLAVPNLFRLVPVDVRAGSRVRATAKVRLPGSGAVTVALGWHDASGAFVGGPQSATARRGTAWTTLSVTGTAPKGARTVVVYLKASGVGGSVWFDDVTVAPVA